MTRLRLAAALATLLALTAADGSGCQKRDDGVTTNRPDRQEPNPLRQRIVFITAKGDLPYQVIVHATRKGETSAFDQSEAWRDGGTYRQTLKYESGLQIEIVATVKSTRPDDGLSCTIKDGGRTIAETGRGLIQCNLTTNR